MDLYNMNYMRCAANMNNADSHEFKTNSNELKTNSNEFKTNSNEFKTNSHTVGTFPENVSLAMAYVPFQAPLTDECMFCPEDALINGTLFKELYKPWKVGAI